MKKLFALVLAVLTAAFAATLFPMGLATTAGSLLSVAICAAAYAVITKKERVARA